MKKNIQNLLFYFALAFITLFMLRFIYGYLAYPNGRTYQTTTFAPALNNIGQQSGGFNFNLTNYASQRIVKKSKQIATGGSSAATSVSVDQKYEKIASLSAQTNKFKEAEKKVRELINNYNALIQFEQNAGLAGHRTLHLAIGVAPEKFDAMTEALAKIGRQTSMRIDKIDKTNEYKDLNAQKVSLENVRQSLIALKSHGGKIEELLKLEERILETDEKIQNLGIKLGEFDKENEFCTIKYTLSESQSISHHIPIYSRLKTAFEWTVKYYFLMVAILFFASLASLVMVLIFTKLQPFLAKNWEQ